MPSRLGLESPPPLTNPSYVGFITDDPQFEQIDTHLAQSLLSHLKAEFSEFAASEDWRDLIMTGLGAERISGLVLVASKRTFEGTCTICQSWERF